MHNDDLIGCLEYDLWILRQGTDLRWLWDGSRRLNYRQVMVFIRHLPSDAALVRRGIGGDPAPTFDDHMRAGIVNQLRILDYHFVGANSSEKDRPEKPALIRLPQ